MEFKIKTRWLLLGVLVFVTCIVETEQACTFPSSIVNKNWTATIFGEMIFRSQEVDFNIVIPPVQLTSWTCHSSSGTKYVVQSKETGLIFARVSYFYYCIDLRRQGPDSYIFYLQSPDVGQNTRVYTENISIPVTLSEVCTVTVDVAEYHVMVNSASPSTISHYCASPLLADFTYKCSASTNDTGTTTTCPGQKSVTFNNTVCSPTDKVLFSETGEFNCIAKTSTVTSGTTIFYQTLYNLDSSTPDGINTFRFVCLAVSRTDDEVLVSATGNECVPGQNATHNTLYTFTPTVQCPITDETSPFDYRIIVGVVVAVVVILIIIGILLFYFCYYKKKKEAANRPIVENTKPRFEDPDKEDIIEDLELVDSMSSPITRDEITFEAMSPTIIANGRAGNNVASTPNNGGYLPNGMANGSVRHDSGIETAEKSHSGARMSLNKNRESMVIFNGDEKVISGNDTRVVPNLNSTTRSFNTSNAGGGGMLTLHGLESEEELDNLGELTERESVPYPSMPREKSNLLPPIETSDPEHEST